MLHTLIINFDDIFSCCFDFMFDLILVVTLYLVNFREEQHLLVQLLLLGRYQL